MLIRRKGSPATLIRRFVPAAFLALAVCLAQAAAIEGPPGFGSGGGGLGGGGIGGGGGGPISSSGLLGEGIDFRGGMLDWDEDADGNRVAILRNYAVVILPQLTISARNMVLNVEMQELYAEGDVLFDEAGGNAFYCDQLTFNYQEWKGLAKNIRVKMDREDMELPIRDFLDTAPSVSSSSGPSLNDAIAGGGGRQGQLKRMYVQARELRAHDSNTFELIDAKITPSSFARPHWYFHSPAALFRQKEKIESYHNTVRVGKVPFLYFPYLIRDLQYDWPWMRLSGGRTSDYGYFVKSQWGWRLQERPGAFLKLDKIIFDLDVFSRRGIGVGAETTYNIGHFDSLGKLKIYGVWESLISRSNDLKRAREDNEDRFYSRRPGSGWEPARYRKDFRWAVDWEHYQQLNELWDVRAEAHLYHDRDYLKDYDTNRYWSAKEPENSIDVRRLDKHWELEFVASSRLSNKWMTQSDYLPEMRLTVPGMQVGDMPLYFKNDFRMGVVTKRFDEDEYRYTHWSRSSMTGGLFDYDPVTGHSVSRLYDRDKYDTFFRAFNEMKFEAPLQFWNAFTLKPWVGLRTAYYSKTQGADYNLDQLRAMYGVTHPLYKMAESGIYHPDMRHGGRKGEYSYAVPLGVELSTRAYTLFGANEQWRLITEPVVSWTENSRPRLNYDKDLYPIDSYDKYYRERRFSVELHTKLQRRYFEESDSVNVPERDILDFNIAFSQYPRKKDRRAEYDYNQFTDITADLIYRPTDWLSLSGSVDYDVDDGQANRAIGQIDWRMGRYLRTYVTHYHYRGNYGTGRYADASPSSQTHVAVRTKLWNDSSRYSVEGAVGYEWRDSDADWRTRRDAVRHGLNMYRVTLFRDMDTFEMALSYVRNRNASDHGVFFSLSPKAFMGYERPPPGYSIEIEELGHGRYASSQPARFLEDGYRIDSRPVDADIKDVQF